MSKLVGFPTSVPTVPIPKETNAAEIVASFAQRLGNLGTHDFKDDAVWRDTFALTGTSRTFYTSSTITAAWHETISRAKAGPFIVDEKGTNIVRTPFGPQWIQARLFFETRASPRTNCTGVITLVLVSSGEWRIWTWRTILEQLKGHPNVDVLDRMNGTAKLTNSYGEESHFDCIVIGGGQAGLSQAGRLKALGVSYVVLDKYQEVGDNWKLRYGSAKCESLYKVICLDHFLIFIVHTSREYCKPSRTPQLIP
jgi:hypothetical protein